MVVLEDWIIIVEQSQLVSGVDEKLVCPARVLHVVNESSKKSGKDLQAREDIDEGFAVEHVVGG